MSDEIAYGDLCGVACVDLAGDMRDAEGVRVRVEDEAQDGSLNQPR